VGTHTSRRDAVAARIVATVLFTAVFLALAPHRCVVGPQPRGIMDVTTPYRSCESFLGVSIRQDYDDSFSGRSGMRVDGSYAQATLLGLAAAGLGGVVVYLTLRIRHAGLDELGSRGCFLL
jgi:hypothetical protein